MAHKVIWTHHAKDRLNERHIPRSSIEQTISHPDRTIDKSDGSKQFQKKIADRTYAAIVKPNEAGEAVILSLWVNPPFPGTRDAKKRSRYLERQHASPGRKLWLTLLDHLGL